MYKTKQQRMDEILAAHSLLSLADYEPTIYPDDFECPETKKIIDIESCESACLNEGCKFLKTCIAYKKAKEKLAREKLDNEK